MENINSYKKGLSVKDLVTTGVFSALLSIAMMIGGIPFGANPFTTFYTATGAAILGGPIFLLLVAKVPKRGVIAIAGIVFGLFNLLAGMHWGQVLGYMLTGIIADFISGTKKYKSINLNIFAYAIYTLGLNGAFIAYFVNKDSWIKAMLKHGTKQEYIDNMSHVNTSTALLGMFLGTMIVATISGLVGKKLLKKQFEKAGILA